VSRVLCVDYGEKRLGLALSDPGRMIASPLGTVSRRLGKRPPWSEIEQVVREKEVGEIVVGLPLNLAGDESPWSQEVREFGAALAKRTGLPVAFYDERLTSVAAERAVRESGLKKSQREEKGRIDAAAAAIILRNYLQSSTSSSG
jgi:putative holliday junction resolvase